MECPIEHIRCTSAVLHHSEVFVSYILNKLYLAVASRDETLVPHSVFLAFLDPLFW